MKRKFILRRKVARRIREVAKSIVCGFLFVGMFFVGPVPPLRAAEVYWDADGDDTGNNATTGANLGGGGFWDTSSLFWWNPLGAMGAWNNTAFDTAVFSGTAGTVTLGAPITAGGLIFNTTGYTITGGTLTLATPTGSPSPAINVSAFTNAAISSIVAGTSGLTKTGNGTLFLTNSGNTYTGDTAITGGALVISHQGQLGTSTSTISVTGIAQTGNPGYSGGQLVVQGGLTGATISRAISLGGRGPGAVNFSGALVSVGNNIFDGNITLGNPATESRVTATHGITTINGNVQLGNSAAQILYGNGNWIINGQVTGFDFVNLDRFIKSGNLVATTLWLANNNNTFAQPLRIDSGTVRVSSNGALGLSGSGINNPAARSVDLLGGALEIHTDAPDFANRQVYNRGTTGIIFTNRALGGSGLNQTVVFNRFDADNATFNHTGRNGYNLTLGGTTGLGTNMQWGSAANLVFNSSSSGTLTLDMNIRHDSETTQRAVSFNGNAETVLTGAFLINGSSNAFSVNKGGIGQMTITNTTTPSTITGPTIINAGTLVYSSANALPTGQIRIGNATTTSGALTYAGAGETISRAILLNTTTANIFMNASGSGAVTYSGAFTAGTGNKTLILGGTNTGDNTISSALPTAGAILNVQKIGSGTWLLSGANTHTGSTTISNGTLKIQDTFSGTSRNVLADAGAIIFNTNVLDQSAGGIFQYLGHGANASAESVGALTATAGAGTVMVTAGSGGTAALTFASLGTVSAGSGVNFVTNTGASATIAGATNTNGIVNAHLFFNGGDFAASTAGLIGAAAYTDESTGTILTGGNTSPYHVSTMDITGQTTATINAGIKFSDSRNFTLGAAQTLTLQNGAATVSGGLLVTGGSTVTISGGTGITNGGAADLVFRTDGASDLLNLNAPILATTTGGWTKLGAGTLVLGAANANTTAGAVHINEGIVRLSGTGRLGADSINVNLRQGATLDLNGINLGTAGAGTASLNSFVGAGTVTNSAAATSASLRIGNANAGGLFTGLIEDGAGEVSLVKAGTGTIHLTSLNTFSGPVTLLAGSLDVTRLANIGSASGIGMGDSTSAATNAASLVFNGGGLRYVGTNAGGAVEATQTPSVSIDRLFTLAGSGRIDSFGSYGNLVQARAANHAALIFGNTGAIAFSGAGARTLTLGGDSLGDNEIALQLINNPNANEALTLVKNGAGMWKLSNSANNYSGQTLIDGGALWAEGTALSVNSNVRLSGSGVLMTSGTFTRALGTAANQVQWNTNQAGGFAASTDRLAVNLGGAGATLNWGTGGIGNGTGALILSSTTSWADVDFQNGINLNVASGTTNRIITVNDNGSTGLDYATISGVISNSGAPTGTGGIIKNGAGTLVLGDANTYNGTTTIANGTLVLSSIGNNTGTIASSVGASGGAIVYNGNTTLNLLYVGAGETADRPINITTALTAARTYRLDSSGSGALVIDNFSNNKTGNFAMLFELRGQNTDGNRINSVIGDGTGGALALAKFDGGVWILGNNSNTFSGGVRADGGLLGLVSSNSVGVEGSLAPTTAASSNSSTVTVGAGVAATLLPGMYVNGTGVGYGDYIVSVNAAAGTFVLNAARTIATGASLQFGGLRMSNGGIFAADPGGLTLDQPVFFNNNSTNVFAGLAPITLNGAFQVGVGNNTNTFSNNLENGALLTINSNLANYKANDQTLFWRGYGNTVWNGNIANATNGTNRTAFDIRVHPDATFTMEGAANTFSGTFTLGQGTLILNKKLTTAGSPGQFNFLGGVLQGGIALTGADAINNNVHLAGDPATFAGTNDITITGTLTNNGTTRRLQNNLTGGAVLTLAGQVNLSEHATTARTMVVQGSGNTLVTGAVTNGAGTGASALLMDGTGVLELTAQATYTGSTTINNGSLVLSGANGRLGGNTTAAVNINGPGAVTLDNTAANPGMANRLNSKPITSSRGTLNFIGNANGSAESIGLLTINSSPFVINMTDNSAGMQTNTLTFASVSIANSGSALDLSSIANLGTVNKVLFTTSTGLGVANGLTTRVYINGHSDFAAYDVANGVVAFNAYNVDNNLDTALATNTLDITGAVTQTGNRTIHAVRLSGPGRTLGNAGQTITLTSGGLISTGAGTNTLAGILAIGGQAHFQVAAGNTLDVVGSITGGNTLAKAGAGTMIFTGKQYFTSTINILGGTLKLDGGLNTIYAPAAASFFNLAPGATLDLFGNTQYVASLSGPGAAPGGGGNIVNTHGTDTATLLTATGATFGGTMSGAINYAKFGGGTQTISNGNAYTGWTLIGGGTTTLRDDGALSGTSAIVVNYGGLNLGNNDNLQRANDNRVNDAASITLRGGTLTFSGRVGSIATETLGALTAAQGASTISVNTTYGSSAFANATLNIAGGLTRSAGATVNFTSNVQLGTGGNHNRILFNDPLPTVLDGALGAWAIANTTDYAAYNSGIGVGVVGTGGFRGYDQNFGSGNITNLGGTHIGGFFDTTLAAGTTTTGLLRLARQARNNIAFSGAGDILNLEEGGLLRENNAFSSAIGTTALRGVLTAGGTEAGGTRELVIYSATAGAPTFYAPNTAGVIALGSPNITLSSTTGLVAGMNIAHASFPVGTTIVSVNSPTQITVSNNATVAAQNTSLTTATFRSSATSGSAAVSMNSTVGIEPGMTITGAGIPAGTYIVSVDSSTQVTVSQNATATNSNQNFTLGMGNIIVNSVIADNGFGNSVMLVKSGAGVLNLSANNTYSGGTIVSQGTLNLIGSGVVVPNGGLTLSGGVVTMLTNAGQIHSGNTVTLNGSSTLTLVGNNTLDGLVFNNHGGTGTPVVTAGGILTLDSATPLTVTSSNPVTFPTINGTLNLSGTGTKTFNIGAIEHEGVLLVDSLPSAVVNAVITGTVDISKTGAGLLQLSGASTFSGGLNVAVGGIVLGASSSASPNTLGSGPLGTGAVTFANGTSLWVNNAGRTVSNAMTFAGNPTFSNTGASLSTLTLNGPLTFSALGTTGLVVDLPTPYLNLVLGGQIADMSSVTAIGSGSGANTINKTGLGNITGINLTGLSNTATLDIGAINNTTSFSLLHDGDGTGSLQTINLGAITWEPASGTVLSLTVSRIGGSTNFPTPSNKTIAPASFNSSTLANGLTVTNGAGYSLNLAQNIAFNTVSPDQGPTFSVSTANSSLLLPGLVLDGQLTGGPSGAAAIVLSKTGNGTLRLGNATNTFGGGGSAINITGGLLEVSSDAALGHVNNVIRLSSNNAAHGLRVSGTFATSREINLNAASTGIDVTQGNTFTLNSALTFATATNALRKNDLGTLVLTQAQPGWDGVFYVLQGVTRIEDGAALGTTTGRTEIGNVGAAIELPGGVTIADGIFVRSTNNSSSNGINGGGAIRSTSGINTVSGAITIDTTTADNNSRAVTLTADSGATLNITGGIVLGLGTGGTNRDNWIGLGGAGTINLTTTAISQTGANGIASLSKFGTGTLNIQVANAFNLARGQNVIIKQGTLSLNGLGTLGTSTLGSPGRVVLNPTGILEINNSASNVNDRLSGRNISVSGADINVFGHSGGSSETVGLFTLREGLSKITLDADAGGALSFATGAITRSAQATLLIRADNFGSASAAGVATFAGSAYPYIGQTGAVATPTKGILPWALGDTNLAGSGIGFVTSDTAASTGTAILRLLAPSEQTTNFATTLANVNLSTMESLSALNTFNSLRLGSGGGVTLNYVPLTLDSGGLLALSGHGGINGFSGVSYLSTTANRELIIHNNADLILNIPIAGTTGGLTKSGTGNLTLAARNSNHGTVMINDGTLTLAGGDHTILPGRNMWVNEGGTLDLNGTTQFVGVLASRLTEVLARNDFFTEGSGGSVINSAGTQATLAIGTGETFAGTISGNIAVARSTAIGATADWNLYSDNSYTGPSLFNGGRVQLLDNGRLSGTSSIELTNATFLATASNASTEGSNITDRVNDAASILIRGGMFQLRNRAALYVTETYGDVTIGEGGSFIDFAAGGTAVNQTDATFASLSRVAGSRGTVRFMNVNGTPSGGMRLFINELNGMATTNIGDGLVNHLIGGWATHDREFASYIPGQGVAALNTAGYAGYSPNLINNGTATDNIRILLPNAGSTTLLTGDVTLNSLNIQAPAATTAGSLLDLGGNTLTLASGGLILSPVSTAALSLSLNVVNGNLTAGTTASPADLYVHALSWRNGQADTTGRADVTLGARIVDNSAGGAVSLVIAGNQGRGSLAATNNVFITGENTHTGGTWVNSGRIVLNTANANGSSITATGTGDLTITGGYGSNPGAFTDRNTQVIYAASNQIANSATVNVMGGAQWNLNNFSQTIAALNFNNHGGTAPNVSTGTGTLTVTGNISAVGQNAGTNAFSTINGKLSLAAATTTLTVDRIEWNGEDLNPIAPNLLINAVIEGTNIVKNGSGLLRLSGANAWSGNFDLQSGGLSLGNNNALSSGSLTIGNGTFLTSNADARVITNAYTVNGNFALRDAFNLTLAGAGTLTAGDHEISVDLATKILTLSGVLGGASGNLNKTGDGILLLTNSNNYGGTTTVSDGILRYGIADAVPTGTDLTVLEGALLDITLGGANVTVGSLSGNSATQGGVIFTGATSGTVVFTAGGNNTSTAFGGVLANAAGSTLEFVKTGSGTLTLGGPNQYNGSTTVVNGRLVAKAVGGNSPLGTSQSLILGGGSTAGILQLGDAGGILNQTFTVLASAGTATTNQIVSGNAAMATLTLDLASTSIFAGNIGGAGLNEGNFNLVKSGAGDLVVSGTGTSTYSGTTTVNVGKLFMDTPGAFSATTAGLSLADGTEFALRGSTLNTVNSYGFSGIGNVITVGSITGATLGFSLDGTGNTRLNVAAGQTMTVNGTLTTAVYVNSAPVSLQDYILINGANANSLHAGSGTFDLNPVIFNGGSFTYALRNETLGGTVDQWILTPTAVLAAADVWWKGDLTGIATGVWSATLTTGTGEPSNWATAVDGLTDALVPPDQDSIVHFSATGAANFNTTLGANMTIQELIFHTGNAATTIGSSNGINTLTLGNTSDPSGITLQTGVGNVGISAIVALAQDQSWNIEDTIRVLNLSGGLTGTARILTVNDTTTNSGTLLFSGSAAAMTGTLNQNAGSLAFEDTGSLNSDLNVVLGTAAKAATLQVGNTAAATGAVIGGLSNGAFAGSRVIGGNATTSTLTLGATSGTHTFSGAVGGAGANENNFNLVKAGAGTQVLNGVITYTGTTLVRAGTLQLGAASTFGPTLAGTLSILADPGATAVFDNFGKSFTTAGVTTLGGNGVGSIAQLIDSAVTKGTITLGGNVVYDGTFNGGMGTIGSNLFYSGVARTITVGDSTNAATDLRIEGTITNSGNFGLTLNGPGNLELAAGGGITLVGGTSASVNFSGTGTTHINAAVTNTGAININGNGAVVNANVGLALDANGHVAITGSGTPGSAILNINTGAQIQTATSTNGILVRNGAIVNVNQSGGIGTGSARLWVGDATSASAAAAAVLNLDTANISVGGTGILVGNGTNIGHITGSGIITTAGIKDLRTGTIAAGITLAGNGAIIKQGTGTLTFFGERAVASTGATTIQEGNLILDYSTNNNSKIGGVLNLGTLANITNGTLTLNGSSSAATVQGVASTLVRAGNTTVAINHGTGQTATLNLGAITRNTTNRGGVVSFQYSSTDAKATSSSPAGTLGWATLTIGAGVERFAAIDALGDIVQVTQTTENNVANWAAGQDIINSGLFTGTVACADIASLTFAHTGASTVTIGSTGHLSITSGGILVDSSVGANNSVITGGTLRGSTAGVPGEIIVHQNNTLGTLTIASRIRNSGGITKAGLGTLVLSGDNTFLRSGSQLSILEGTVRLANVNALSDRTAVYLRQGTTLDLNGLAVSVGNLVNESNGTLALGATGNITFNQTANISHRGLFTGGATSQITLNGGAFNFNYTGATTTGFTGAFVVNSGLLQLSAGGRLANATSITINKNGTLLLDNNTTTRSGDRILNTATITLNSADGAWSGTTQPRGLSIRSDQDATLDETVGVVTFNSGASYASLEATTANDDSDIIAANFVRANSATLNVRGTNLGSVLAQNNQFRIATGANQTAFLATLVGGSGAAGNHNISIVPWAIGETVTGAIGVANMGNSLVTYVADAGFRPLNFTNEYDTFTLAAATDNVRESLSVNLTGLAGKTINSLVINRNLVAAGTTNVTGTGVGQTLTNTSGAFLFTLIPTATASTAHNIIVGGFDDGIQVGAPNEYVFHVVNPSSAATTATLTARIDSSLNTVAASLTKSGRGTLELNAVNTYGGGTTINEGRVLIHDNDNLGAGGLTFAGGILSLAADYADDLGALTTATANIFGGGGTIEVLATSVTATDLVTTGSGTLTKTGTGTLQLAGTSANTHTGAFAVLRGILQLNKTAGTNAVSGSSLIIGGSSVTGETATVTLLASNQISNTTAVSVSSIGTNAIGTFNVNGQSETIGSLNMTAVTFAGVLVQTGAGGTLQVNGDITLNSDRGIADAGTNARNVVISATGTNGVAAVGGGTLDLGGVARTITVQTTSTLGGNNDATIEAVIANGGIVKEGARRLYLSANNTYSGSTTINEGTISISSSANLGDGSATNTIAINNNATLQATGNTTIDLGTNRNVLVGGDGATFEALGTTRLEVSGIVSSILDHDDCAVITVNGPGTVVLSGTNTYKGETHVDSGVLLVNGNQSAATGNVIVASGATLGGSGTIGGDTFVSGTLSTGDPGLNGGVGSLDFAGGADLTFTSGSTWLIDILQDVNGSSDFVSVDALNIDGGANLSFAFAGTFTQGNVFTIANYASWNNGTFNAFVDDYVFEGGGGFYQINYNDGNAITLTAVPEPGTLGFLGLALGGFFFRRLRKRRAEMAAVRAGAREGE